MNLAGSERMGDVHGNTEEPTSSSLALLRSDALGTMAWPPSYTLHDRMALPTVVAEICDLALIGKDSEDLHIQFSQEGRNKQGSTLFIKPSFIRTPSKGSKPTRGNRSAISFSPWDSHQQVCKRKMHSAPPESSQHSTAKRVSVLSLF